MWTVTSRTMPRDAAAPFVVAAGGHGSLAGDLVISGAARIQRLVQCGDVAIEDRSSQQLFGRTGALILCKGVVVDMQATKGRALHIKINDCSMSLQGDRNFRDMLQLLMCEDGAILNELYSSMIYAKCRTAAGCAGSARQMVSARKFQAKLCTQFSQGRSAKKRGFSLPHGACAAGKTLRVLCVSFEKSVFAPDPVGILAPEPVKAGQGRTNMTILSCNMTKQARRQTGRRSMNHSGLRGA